MIVELAQSIQQKEAQKEQLNRAALARKDIEATRDSLSRLQKASLDLKQSYTLIYDRLPPQFIAAFYEQLSDIAKDVDKSRFNFEEISRQVKSLDALTERVGKIARSMQEYWTIYANRRVEPYTELLELVGSLPEVVAQEASLNRLRDRLGDLSARLPQSATQVAEFDSNLHQLSTQLAALENLVPEVKSFLRKVVDGKATIEDLSPEVLAWCQDHSHSSAFTISFRQRRGAI